VIPEKLENKFCMHPLITQCFMYGDSLQNFLVGVVVPDKDQVLKVAEEKGLGSDFEAVIKKDEMVNHFLAEMKKAGKEAGFFGFEIPLKLHLTSTAFSVENEILTPTFKLKRNDAKKFFYT
jgi:long-chain acyl-CoA synthetase